MSPQSSNAPTYDDINFLYKLFLKREIESKLVYDRTWANKGWRDCISLIKSSAEYREYNVLHDVRLNHLVYLKTIFDFIMPISLLEPFTLKAYDNEHGYEPEESALIAANLSPGDVAVDLGARHGWFTGLMAQAVGESGRVYSFEPMPPLAGVRELVAVNSFSNVDQFDVGVADRPGELLFDEIYLSASQTGTRRVEVTTLDTNLKNRTKPVKLVKMDIEGAEPLAIKGAKQIISQDHPIIVMEVNKHFIENGRKDDCEKIR